MFIQNIWKVQVTGHLVNSNKFRAIFYLIKKYLSSNRLRILIGRKVFYMPISGRIVLFQLSFYRNPGRAEKHIPLHWYPIFPHIWGIPL